ncbi:MAG: hypothetical protein ACOH2M_15420 [Cypionkella sp.]
MAELKTYQLFPTVPAGGQDWRLSADRGEVVVQAQSTGEARAVAAMAEARAFGNTNADITTEVSASAFLDPNLYGVREDGRKPQPPSHPRVLKANFRRPDGFVVHSD